MRIIENHDEVRIECPWCHSVLGIHVDDIKDDFHGTYVVCAVCGKSIPIKRKDIPNHWISMWKLS